MSLFLSPHKPVKMKFKEFTMENLRMKNFWVQLLLREKCPYSEFFWSVFSRIWTEYLEIRSISPYSVRMRETTDQKNSEYGHFWAQL